jgi:hypothetical protein
MNFIQRLFGAKAPASNLPSHAHSQLSAGSSSRQLPQSQNGARRELLRVVLRDTLQRHGIPAHWIGAEYLNATSRNGERGIHWRLQVKHWDPRILIHAMEIQRALIKRVTTFDPLAPGWLNGISWQFALTDESVCPPLPHPGSWTAEPHQSARSTPAGVAIDGGGIIEGPVHIATTPQASTPVSELDATRADLAKLLAIRDADFERNAGAAPAWTRTEPADL